MKRVLLISLLMAIFCFTGIANAINLDEFNGKTLDKMWTVRDPAKKCTYKLEGGKLLLDLKAGADMYIKGTDGGVCFLMDPPDLANFSVEMLLNVTTMAGDKQAPACHAGPLFFNEAQWVYSAWGPYNAGQDIRLEDCVGGSYRWRNETQIAVDVAKVAIDKDLYLKITKTGNKLEFFAKGNAGDQWVSGGVDEKLGPNYTKGNYKVGIFAKSWGGSVDTSFAFEYFDIPEVPKAVDSHGKLATTWSSIKN